MKTRANQVRALPNSIAKLGLIWNANFYYDGSVDIEWPAGYPNFSPKNFPLWGHLYETTSESFDYLGKRISHECRNLAPEMLTTIRRSFYRQVICSESSVE